MYIVNVYTFYPYKREYEYRVEGSNFSVAISRATKLFRKEPQLKGKKYKELFVKAIKA